MQNHKVYILNSAKLDRNYIGCTSDIDIRMAFHANAETHKFTAKADDWVVILIIGCENKSQAFAIEKHIKEMKSKVYIQNLIKYPEMQEKLLIKYSSVG